jgi:DNA-binding LacI/PurR family transcriptional regulator
VEPRVLFWIDELRDSLAKERCELKFLNYQSCYSERPQRALEKLAARLRPSTWVLLLATRAMQEWFVTKGLPTVSAGSCYEGIRLPAVDVDYRATCQHAVGRFLAKGHRCLALVHPQRVFAGGLRTEAGFVQAGARAGPGVETVVARHDGTVPGVCGSLDRLLARPNPPTAFLVCRPGDALTALGHLIQRGFRFPENAALISRDHDRFLELVVPSMARYRMDLVSYANKLSRVVLDLTSGGNPPHREHLLMPQFIPGQTLG